MTHAICVQVFSDASLEDASTLIESAVEKAGLRRHSDYISRVILLCTPHFAPLLQDLAQMCVSKTNCMNVWGGCASGLLGQGQVYSNEPTILVAVFGKEFETPQGNIPARHTALNLCMVEHEQVLTDHWTLADCEPDSSVVQADTLGLLSYGANYAKMPRVEHGRICGEAICATQLLVQTPLILNSEGLTFLGPYQTVTESNGLFLIRVGHEKAATALQCPGEQPRPVGMRLQVVHDKGESWIPVMEIHADGTLGLAAPVLKGQKVRLAHRTPKAIDREIHDWMPAVTAHFSAKAPNVGILFAGFERSQMCHADDNDIATVLSSFPDTEWIGVFGQAAWLNQGDTVVTPPRNNRLSLCLFNSPQMEYTR
ncbi:hypothetical protein [Limnobacter sp. MED105]|uniref:hypothetical protein n=1 Tax=Limnobacter sp. MED105 TaxID=391597 RepID=UPI000156C2F3|nr:hypothetical protein [Limnobacter sp. MED105]EDM84270.1 hypothetical protein LMED105_01868 [Limnobacter sp. MED105]